MAGKRMTNTKISVEDWVDISNLLGKYQWLVDECDEDGWSGLFTEDGVFEGLGPIFRGREELKQIPRASTQFNGFARHLPGSLWMEYGATQDEVLVRLYTMISMWAPEPQFLQFALATMHLVRRDGGWLVKSNTIKCLRDMSQVATLDDPPAA
jgi:hypothetical protein